jgi:hypothetical protein
MSQKIYVDEAHTHKLSYSGKLAINQKEVDGKYNVPGALSFTSLENTPGCKGVAISSDGEYAVFSETHAVFSNVYDYEMNSGSTSANVITSNLVLYKLEGGWKRQVFSISLNNISGVALNSDGSVLAIFNSSFFDVSSYLSIYTRSGETFTLFQTITVPLVDVYSISFADLSDDIVLYQKSSNLIKRFTKSASKQQWSLARTISSNTIDVLNSGFAMSRDGSIYVISDFSANNNAGEIYIYDALDANVSPVTWSPDGVAPNDFVGSGISLNYDGTMMVVINNSLTSIEFSTLVSMDKWQSITVRTISQKLVPHSNIIPLVHPIRQIELGDEGRYLYMTHSYDPNGIHIYKNTNLDGTAWELSQILSISDIQGNMVDVCQMALSRNYKLLTQTMTTSYNSRAIIEPSRLDMFELVNNNGGYQSSTASSGSTVLVSQNVVLFQHDAGATVASLTIQLPRGVISGQRLTLYFVEAVTSLTVKFAFRMSTDITPIRAPTSASAGDAFVFEYIDGIRNYIRIS